MQIMASLTCKNAENGRQAAAMMSETDQMVREANGALGEMVTSMQAVVESSGRVSKISKTIDEIAFQTNILAVNAAVEAAREMGNQRVAQVSGAIRAITSSATQVKALVDAVSAASQEQAQGIEQVTESVAP